MLNGKSAHISQAVKRYNERKQDARTCEKQRQWRQGEKANFYPERRPEGRLMKERRTRILSFASVLLLMLLTSAWISRGIYRFSHLQMDTDEALHANRGLYMTSRILDRDPGGLWHEFSKPDWYPPGHGILLGTWMAILGPSIRTARLYSAFCYLLLGLILWWSTREMLPEASKLVYLVPPLFLITDSLHSVHAGLSMLELPAITYAFCGLLFLSRTYRQNSLLDHFLTLFFGLTCLFTKYSYGIILFAVIFTSHALMMAEQISKKRAGRPDGFQKKYLILFWVIFGLVAILWFFGLGQWRWFADYAAAQPEGYAFWSPENLTYYPRLVWQESLNWLAILLSVAGVIQMIRSRRFLVGTIPYLLFFGISLVMLTLELQDIPRFGMILFPPLWITAAAGVHAVFSEFSKRWSRVASVALIAGLLYAGISNYSHFTSRLFVEYENTNDGVDQAYRFISEALNVTQHHDIQVVMLGRTDQWNGQALQFHLQAKCLRAGNSCNISVQDDRILRKGWPELSYPEEVQEQRIHDALEAADALIHFYHRREQPEGWALVNEKKFVFEQSLSRPEVIWVSIYKP